MFSKNHNKKQGKYSGNILISCIAVRWYFARVLSLSLPLPIILGNRIHIYVISSTECAEHIVGLQ